MLTDSYPKLAALSGADIEGTQKWFEAVLRAWTSHDILCLYPGAAAVEPSIFGFIKTVFPTIRLGLYHNFLRVLDTDVRTYWPGMPLRAELALLEDSEHWPGWSKVNHSHEPSRDKMTTYHRDDRARLKPDFLMADECHADLSFMPEVDITPQYQYAAMSEVLRKSGGAMVNGNFGYATPNFPDGTWTSMIRGRFLQHAENLTGQALFDMAKLLITESSLLPPNQRDFIIDGGGIKSLVLACLCDGGSGGMWPDYRQSLATLPLARGVLGQKLAYKDGRASKPCDALTLPFDQATRDGLLMCNFENGDVFVDHLGGFGVELR